MTLQTVEKAMIFALVAIALSFATIAPGLSNNTAYANGDRKDDKIDLEKIAPKALDSVKLDKVKDLALKNEKVKELTAGKKVEYMSQSFVGNIYDDPVVWTPEIRFNVDDTYQIIAVVNPENNTVTQVETAPLVKLAADNGERSFAVDYYTGSSTITGLGMEPTAPTYTATSTDTLTALLVNAIKSGSNTSQLCNSAYWPSTAWFQAGFAFYPTTGYSYSGGKIIWTDTQKDCYGQVTTVPYNGGNNYRFRIYSDSTNGNWVIYMYNISTGNASTVIVIGPSTYTILKNNGNTSVFFENTNTNTTWDNQFSGKTSVGNVYKYMRVSGSSSWSSWNGNTQAEADCNGGYADTVISPNTGNPINFNLSTFSDNYPAC